LQCARHAGRRFFPDLDDLGATATSTVPDCGIKAPSRDAAARYRQTKKYRETYQKWAEKGDLARVE
jgi:hypothetical protein